MKKITNNPYNFDFLKVLYFGKQKEETFDQNFARLDKK